MNRSFKHRKHHFWFGITCVFVLLTHCSWGQLVIDNTPPNNDPATLVQNVLLGNGVTATNVTFVGDNTIQLGFFDGTNSNIGLNSGIVLSTGDVNEAVGPNDATGTTSPAGGVGGAGDPDLSTLINGVATNDAAILEFDFVPIGDSLVFRYVFSSEEYNEFTCSNFNDVFGFFISGPGFSGPFSNGAENIALIPGTTTPVAINSVNNGTVGASGNQANCDAIDPNWMTYTNLFNDNAAGTSVQFDGFTTVLAAEANVVCGETYHIKLAVADGFDGLLDSGVFLEAESFTSPGITIDITTVSGDTTIVEGCALATFTFTRPDAVGDQVVGFQIEGNAINGTDYQFIPDSVVIADGTTSNTVDVIPLGDGIVEGVDTIIITVFNVNSCGDTVPAVATILIQDENTLDVTATDVVSNCPGDQVTLMAGTNGGTPNFIYTWDNGLMGQTITVAPLATDTIVVQSFDNDGCTGTDTSIVTVTPLFIPDAGADVGICIGTSTTIGGAPTGPAGSTFSWTPTLGLNNPNASNPVASPTTTTMYTVSVTDLNGCTNTDSVLVTVFNSPPADAGPDAAICIGGNTMLTASGGVSYAWTPTATLNNAAISNPTANPTTTTTYTVTVTDGNGCSATDDVTITVNPLPLVDAGANQSICPGASANIGGAPTGPAGSAFAWNNAGSLDNNLLANPTASPTTTTTYNVTVTDINGCVNTDNVTVNVFAPAVADAGLPQTICIGDTATLTASGGVSYSWQPTASLTSPNAATTGAFPTTTTTYTVTVTDANTCTATDDVLVTVNALPLVDAGADQTICIGTSVMIGGTPTAPAGSNVAWLPAGSLNDPAIMNPNAAPTTTTVYTVTATDVNGCVNTDDVQVIVNPLPVVDAGADVAICEGTSTTIGGAPTGPAGSNFTWTPGATLDNSANANPSATPPAGNTVYTVQVTDVNGCQNTDNVTVSVNAAPTISAGADAAICLNDSTQLMATGGTSYVWTPATGLSNTTVANPMASPATTTTYTVTGTDANNCTNTASVTITVNSLPTADAGPDVPWLCPGDTTQLNGSGGVTFAWTPAADLNDPNLANPLATPGDTTTFILTVFDANGCSAVDSMTVITNDDPPTNAGMDVSICVGDTVQIGGAPTSIPGSSYAWSPSGSIVDNTLENPMVFPTLTTDFVVLVTNDTCTNRDTVTVTVNQLPNADAGPDTAICINESVQLMGSGGVTYSWDPAATLDDPNIATPIATPTDTTLYFITVTDTNGCTNMDSLTVTVNPLPTVTAGPDTIICAGDSIQLFATGGLSYIWDPVGSLSDPALANPIAFPTISTTYTVIATDSNSCVNTATTNVAVNALPPVNAGPDTALCINDTIQLNATGASNYVWMPADSLSDPMLANPLAFPVNTTTYLVTGTDTIGCAATDTIVVTVNQLPLADAGIDTAICFGDQLELMATGGVGFIWTPAGSLSDAAIFNPIATPDTTTLFHVTVTDTNGCVNLDSVLLTVNPLPIPSVGPDASICRGDTTQLMATGGTTFLWTPALNISDVNSASPFVFPDSTQQYEVLVTDSNGCQASDTLLVNVFRITISQDTSLCEGDSVQLFVNGPGANVFDWTPVADLNDPSLPNPFASPSITTLYSVSVTDTVGCIDSANVEVVVNINPDVSFTVELEPSCDGILGKFTNLSTDAETYLWDFGTGETSTEFEPEYVFPFSSNITVTLTGSTSFGCADVDTFTNVGGSFEDFFDIELPNVFSPNGDGMNDVFRPRFNGVLGPCTELSIYNRWGQLMFISTGNNVTWDGRTNAGIAASAGTFFYTLVVKDKTFKGSVTLLR